MKIILKQDVESLGHKGSIIDVADGYARNFLIPKGFALVATKGAVRQAAEMTRAREAAQAKALEDANAAVATLTGKTVRIAAKVGEGGKLFGSVGAAEIAEAATQQTGVNVDRQQVQLEQNLREAGTTRVAIALHPEVSCEIDIEIAAS